MAVTEYGSVIRIVEKDVLDSFTANWTLESTRVPGDRLDYYTAYAMDPVDPLAFWLWPRGYEGADVIVTFAGIPAAPTTMEEDLTLSDMYLSAIVDYVAYRALAKESRAGAREIAEGFLNRFLTQLGANRQVLRQIGQNTTRPPDAEA
jgi:hypothetical protein